MSFTVVIPARHASTRLPGKMLLKLGGKPMIQHVYERASESGASRVIIATDHQNIVNAVNEFSGEVVLTAESHQSGTERIAEVITKLEINDGEIIVNVQGDEPLIEPDIIKGVAKNLQLNPSSSISTVCTPIKTSHELHNPNIVKVVMGKDNDALYFSRATIPWPRDKYYEKEWGEILIEDISDLDITFYRHIGIYAYKAQFVKTYVGLAQSPLEKIEALEQLRALYHGHRINVFVSNEPGGIGIDTQEDYDKVKEIIERC